MRFPTLTHEEVPTMPLGVTVTTSEAPPTSGPPTATGTGFFVGVTDTGDATTPSLSRSIAQWAAHHGARSATNSVLYDAADVFFREGGSSLYTGRVLGPAAAKATITVPSSSSQYNAVAASEGVWGNGLTFTMTSGVATIRLNGVLMETSPTLTTVGDLKTWAATSSAYVRITEIASLSASLTTSAARSLATGTDDASNATITQWTTAIGVFGTELGPGQVAAPGVINGTLAGIWAALLTHASANNRFACLDVLAAGCVAPGVTPGTTRTVASSAVAAALCARVDATGNPNQAAAGPSWPLRYIIDFAATATSLIAGISSITTSQTASYGAFFGGDAASSADQVTLNDAGINTFSSRSSGLQNFGFSTPVLPAADGIYWQASHSRLRMALVAAAQSVGEPFLFSQLDGKGLTIAGFGSAISDMLAGFYRAGALFGATPPEAFSVNVSANVNTPTTIAAGHLKATATVRMSPFAQAVDIELSSIPVTQTL